MKFFWGLFLSIIMICGVYQGGFSAQDPVFPKPRQQAMPRPPSAQKTGGGLGDDYGLPHISSKGQKDPFPPQDLEEEDYDEEYNLPPPSPRGRPAALPPQGFQGEGDDYDLPPLSAKNQGPQKSVGPRQGFHQVSGMNAPQRISPSKIESDGLEDGDFLDPELDAGQSVRETPVQMPPKNYPPKIPELQLGQTGWNQLNLHSLVEGRSE